MTDFMQKYGPWAVVTGASSGLGAEFARQLAAHGLNLALVARRLGRLEGLGAELSDRFGCAVRPVECDLRHNDFWTVLGPRLLDLDIGLVVCNAGFANTGAVVDNDLSRELDLLSVNCRAPLLLAHALGRRLVARGRGGIVLTSSITAFAPAALWANYSASKAYLLSLAEAMHLELRPRGVDVLAVCPGPVRTEFYGVADQDLARTPLAYRFLLAEPTEVVATALSALGRRRSIAAGRGSRWLTRLGRFAPRRFYLDRTSSFVASLRRDP